MKTNDFISKSDLATYISKQKDKLVLNKKRGYSCHFDNIEQLGRKRAFNDLIKKFKLDITK